MTCSPEATRRGTLPAVTPAEPLARINGPKVRVAQLGAALRRRADDLASVLYPAACAACGCDADTVLCPRCRLDLDALADEPAHPCCGRPAPADDDDVPCPHCGGASLGRLTSVARLGRYDGPLAAMILAAKYAGRWEVADWLGDRLSAAKSVARIVAGDAVIVPVPLHASRRRSRGYNQSRRLADRLGLAFDLPVIEPAVRVRPTRAQASLRGHAARRANVADAFAVLDPAAVEGRVVVLVDDVLTSGATLRSLAHALHAARPAGLRAVVAAVA